MTATLVELPPRCATCDESPLLRRALGARALAGRILRAQEEERARVARELHDETGQALTLMLVRLTTLEAHVSNAEARAEIDALHELVGDTLDGVRRLATDLGPTVLRDLGLGAALDVLAARVRSEAGITVGVKVRADVSGLPDGAALALYRVAQEALTNVVRHARATTASLRLDPIGAGARLVIEDDGVGFDVSDDFGNGSIGLYGMRERLELVGGTLDVSSKRDHGTRVAAVVPGAAS